jgi:hypothetical protein
MPAVPGRLGNVELVGRDVGALAGTAADLDVEGVPPLAVMRRGAGMAAPALAGGEVLECTLGMSVARVPSRSWAFSASRWRRTSAARSGFMAAIRVKIEL